MSDRGTYKKSGIPVHSDGDHLSGNIYFVDPANGNDGNEGKNPDAAFSTLTQAFLVVLRLLIGALSCSFFFAVTNPSDLTRILEKCKVPTKWALVPALALTMVPRVAKDAEETFETLTLRGEISGFFLKWLPKALAIFVASVLYRSEFLAQSLYFRGLAIQKRTHYRLVPFRKRDLLRLFTWLIFVTLIFLLDNFDYF